MSSKKILIVVAALLVLGIALYGVKKLYQPTFTDTFMPANSTILGGVATTSETYEFTESAPYYTVDVQYPTMTSGLSSAEANKKAELTIEQTLSDDIAQFKNDGNFANL